MVSVIVPVYNVEKYLPICIESVMAQTYKDFELILVDDDSKDNSLAICNDYASKDSRVKVIHQENKGLSGARNAGVLFSKGDYIFFVDSDDCVDERLLEVTVKIAECEEYKSFGIVQINLKTVDEEYIPARNANSSLAIYDNKLELDGKTYRIDCFNQIDAFFNLDRDNKEIAEDIRLTTTVAWSKLYRREAFKNLLFPETVRLHEDQMMAHRRIQEAQGMIFVDIPLYYYRQANNNSLIRVGWTPKRLTILDCYEDRLNCASEINKEQMTDESQKLIDYIYYRTLVCFFRNYCMVTKYVDGADGKKYKRNILNRFCVLLRNRTGKIGFIKRVFFSLFTVIPDAFAVAFNIRNK